MTNLLAACRVGNHLEAKRVRTSQAVQERLGPLFDGMEAIFFDGIEDEVEFDGGWKPDDSELLIINNNVEALALRDALTQNVLALPEIDTANFGNENIRALAVVKSHPGQNPRILIQAFSAQQILNRRFTLLQEGNSFKQMTENAFAIGTTLNAVIDGNTLKFRSFHNLKKIFDLVEFYKAATDAELANFCGHAKFQVENVEEFKIASDQIVRKLVHAVSASGILDHHDVVTIAGRAAALGVEIDIIDGRIRMPRDRKDIKLLLRFLDDAVYEGALSQQRYQTNSKRPLA